MMKIAFYIPNLKIKDVDLSSVQIANPGIGGTEYTMLALCYYLSKFQSIDLITYFESQPINYLANSDIRIVQNLQDAMLDAVENGVDVFVLHHSQHSMEKKTFSVINGTKMSVVIWIHNFPKSKHLRLYNSISCIKRIVFVGREFYNCYRDHSSFFKATWIYNGIYIPELIDSPSYIDRPNNVTYIGNIIKGKGFHILAQIWKDVVKEVPTAHLHVIGSGRLYNRNLKVGKYGIAEERYENKFMKYLVDEHGKILPSVTFYGIMGNEKNQIIRQTKVGVPNPSGYSETFGYTAIEMEMLGCLVTTIKCPGYVDTVSESGILYDNTNQLAESIVKLLSRNQNEFERTLGFIRNKFDFRKIASNWLELFSDVIEHKPVIVDSYVGTSRKSIFRNRMYILKCRYKFLSFLPALIYVEQFIHDLFSISYYKGLLSRIIKH